MFKDGLRFASLALLQAHTDAYLERKKILKKKKESSDSRERRGWYCTTSQWITDFNSLIENSKGMNANSSGVLQNLLDEEEEYIVPADEYFTRCPVSKELFESIWDDDEGDFMYRNAVKVLVTEQADTTLFSLGQPTSEPTVHYLIVHKLLVLDGWLNTGKAVSLKDACLRYDYLGSDSEAKKLSEKLLAAAGDEESEDDIFVVLENP